jgi:putative polyhydroxyalkanoate system protein
MPNLTVSIPHQLGRAQARQRIQTEINQLKQQYGALGQLQETWNGDKMAFTLSTGGVTVTGHLDVQDRVVNLEVPLPWPIAALAGFVKHQIEQQGRKLLGKP